MLKVIEVLGSDCYRPIFERESAVVPFKYVLSSVPDGAVNAVVSTLKEEPLNSRLSKVLQCLDPVAVEEAHKPQCEETAVLC